MVLAIALLAGIAAGLRTFLPIAAVSLAARSGALPLADTWLSFLGFRWTHWIFAALTLVEFVTDQLPSTPSRTVPMQLGPRVLSGALCGAAVGSPAGSWVAGAAAGIVGSLVGTYGGAKVRSLMARAFGRDTPAALIEDAIAVVLGFVVVNAL